MRTLMMAAVSASTLVLLALGVGVAAGDEAARISGPVAYDNLAVYFIHGKSASGKVPLTLDEALAKGTVRVLETGDVNELQVENLGEDEVFVQSGDIVKGGRQDRTLMVSLILPPRSGRIPIASFCVEQGRWSGRGGESAGNFATASATVPSREMKLAMKAPAPASPPVDPAASRRSGGVRLDRVDPAAYAARMPDTASRQQQVWADVQRTQAKLSENLRTRIQSPLSDSSLQLALENEKLIDARKAYLVAIRPAGERDDDIVGYVFAVNGKLNSADVYPSNGLFRKMWGKLIEASAIEAISHLDAPREPAPSIEAVAQFLAVAEGGAARETPLNTGARLTTRDAPAAYLFETARADGWVHRNYLAK